VRTTLAELPEVTLEPPVTIVIGKVAGLDLRWFEGRPLFGRRVVVTRARAQASTLVDKLSALGAETVELPTIEIAGPADGGESLAAAAARLGSYEWVVFTSVNAVDRLFENVRDARAFGAARVAAVGPGTAAALADRGVVADLQPATAVAAALVHAFPAGAGRVLVPQAAAARPVLAEGLRAKGWLVEVVEAYRTVPARPSDEALAAAAKADAIAFTSSSTVTSWLALAGVEALPPVVACIGPVTAATAAEHGVPVSVVADEHTVDGLVAALVAALR
jgi:uroporphyrinogen III methyltransferase/synthase